MPQSRQDMPAPDIIGIQIQDSKLAFANGDCVRKGGTMVFRNDRSSEVTVDITDTGGNRVWYTNVNGGADYWAKVTTIDAGKYYVQVGSMKAELIVSSAGRVPSLFARIGANMFIFPNGNLAGTPSTITFINPRAASVQLTIKPPVGESQEIAVPQNGHYEYTANSTGRYQFSAPSISSDGLATMTGDLEVVTDPTG